MPDSAKNGDKVKVHFVGKTEKGEVFATSQGHEPLEFQIGDGSVLPGLEKAIQGMEKGENKIVTLPPQDGFGEQNDSLVLTVERSQFPQDFDPQEGMEMQVPQPDGSVVFFKILKVEGDQVQLDANHPLAGSTIIFELELLEIS